MYQTNFSNNNKLFGGSLLRNSAKTDRWLFGLCLFLMVGCGTQDVSNVSIHLAPELNGRMQIAMDMQKVVLNFTELFLILNFLSKKFTVHYAVPFITLFCNNLNQFFP